MTSGGCVIVAISRVAVMSIIAFTADTTSVIGAGRLN